jgi:hypothetical protein
MFIELDERSLDLVVGGQGDGQVRQPLEQPFDDPRYTRQEICSHVQGNVETWRNMARAEQGRGQHRDAQISRQNAMRNEQQYLKYCWGS